MDRRRLVVASIVAVLSLTLVPVASAQALDWVDQFGSVEFDTAWSVATTGGAVYVAGETTGHLPGKTSHGSLDGFLTKYSAAGTPVWARQFGTTEADVAYGVAADATGIYVVGYTQGAFPGEKAKGGRDGFLRKFTASGNTVWTHQFGTTRGDGPTNVAVGPDGVSVIGWTNGTFADQRRHGQADAFLLQFDTSGSRVWAREFGSREYEIPYGVAADANGIVVDGLTYGTLPGQTSHGDADAFVTAFAPDGSRRWTHQIGTKRYDDGSGASVSSGVVYITGTTTGALAEQRNRGSGDAYVRAYTANGSGLWTRQFGTDKGDAGIAVAADPTGIYVTGGTAGRLGHQPNPDGLDVYVRAFDFTGAGMWTSQFGSDGLDAPWSDATDGAGTVYVVGAVDGGAMPTQTVVGSQDAFVAHVG
jgi:Beta-propeller repeat